MSIQSNRLTKFDGLADLPSLEELYASHNALTQTTGLEANRHLRVIDISNNHIASLTGLQHLGELEELWASSNQLSSFTEIEKELREKRKLNTVYFEGNPLQTDHVATYRNKIKLALPQIKQIDASKWLVADVTRYEF